MLLALWPLLLIRTEMAADSPELIIFREDDEIDIASMDVGIFVIKD